MHVCTLCVRSEVKLHNSGHLFDGIGCNKMQQNIQHLRKILPSVVEVAWCRSSRLLSLQVQPIPKPLPHPCFSDGQPFPAMYM